MAHVEESNTGKKNISVELNLVPFIDLMSVCIIFLLITAVWTQVSMIQLGSSLYSKKTGAASLKSPHPLSEIVFRVSILETGFEVIIGKEKVTIPMKNNKYNENVLLRQVKKVKELYPEKVDVVVSSRNSVKYEHLVTAMDILLLGGFPEVVIATGEM